MTTPENLEKPIKKRRNKLKIDLLRNKELNKNLTGKAFIPTEQMRTDVRTMASLGMPEKAMAILTRNPETGKSIDVDTLRKHFEKEIIHGAAHAYRSTLMNLFRLAQSKETNSTVLAAIEKFLKIVGKRFEDKEDQDQEQQPGTVVNVHVDNRSQVAFTKEELFKLPKEDLKTLHEIRQKLPDDTENTV